MTGPARAPGTPTRILVTRPAGRGDALARRLERRGARVDLRPTIAFEGPADATARDGAAARVATYRRIVVTSPTGARFLLDALEAAGVPVPPGERFAVVGPGTAAALRVAGVRPACVARRADAEGLAVDLLPAISPGDAVLVVRPESGARDVLLDALREAGAEVDAVPFYRTVAAPGAAAIVADLDAGRYDVAVFSSPSTFRMLLSAAPDRARIERALAAVKRVAIGPVTARALAEAGLSADAVAEAPTDEAIESAVASLC